MNDIFIGTPGSVQRDIATTWDRPAIPAAIRPSELSDNAVCGEIAEVAYRLWHERGCPSGSAEADWLEAEQEVRARVNQPYHSLYPC
jgi:hypothetical protein